MMLCVRHAAVEQATAQLDRMAVDKEPPAADDAARQPDGIGGGRGGSTANGPSSSAQPPDRPRSAAPSAPASGTAQDMNTFPGLLELCATAARLP